MTLFNCFQQLGLAVGPMFGALLISYCSYEFALLVTGSVLVLFG